jgi:hypothetical protein
MLFLEAAVTARGIRMPLSFGSAKKLSFVRHRGTFWSLS